MIRESAELRAVVTRFLAAMERLDGPTAANFFLRADATRYIGTDPQEWWSGSAFVDAYPKHVASWPTLKIDVEEMEAFESDGVGWAAVRAVTKFGDADFEPVRFSFVFTLDGGMWRLVQMHSSLGVPNVEWIGVELTGALEQLLASIEGPYAPEMPVRDGTVSLVFTDIEDSTQMAAQLGDAVWVEALQRHHRAIEEVVGRKGGTVVKTLGDGAMIVFASTREAVRAAVEIQQRQSESAGEVAMGVRIGVHVGDAVAADRDYLGTTVNKAARIAAAADGGQIMVSDAVRVLLADTHEFSFGDTVSMKLKGLDGVHQVTPVLWGQPAGG